MLESTNFLRDNTSMTADPLSDLLNLVRARCSLSGKLVAGGTWARRFANLDAIKFCAAIEGHCWSYVEGMPKPVWFERGDVLVLNGTRSLVLASDPRLVSGAVTTPHVQDGDGNYRLGQGDGFTMLGGMVQIDAQRQPLLLGSLGPLIHVNGNDPAASNLGWLLEQIVEEMAPPCRPGHSLVVAELAQLLFVQTLRAHLSRSSEEKGGWLRGLGDKRLAPALAGMHAEPARDWSLDDLAREAGMSRTSFAVRFRDVMGMPPLTYLTNWRMHLAERDLRAGTAVVEVASAIGYTSESAFSHAFKRTMGVAPGRYRKAFGKDASMSEIDRDAKPADDLF